MSGAPPKLCSKKEGLPFNCFKISLLRERNEREARCSDQLGYYYCLEESLLNHTFLQGMIIRFESKFFLTLKFSNKKNIKQASLHASGYIQHPQPCVFGRDASWHRDNRCSAQRRCSQTFKMKSH